MKIKIETETRTVESNGWVNAGAYCSASFAHPQPEGVKGCPLGRSQESMEDAIRDLVLRTNGESGTTFKVSDFEIVRHNRQPVEAPAPAPVCPACNGTGHDKAHEWPDGSPAACEPCDGYGRPPVEAPEAPARARSAIFKLPQYDPAAPRAFDALEVHTVIEETDPEGGTFCESLPSNTEIPEGARLVFSLYGHTPGAGLECIGDFSSFDAACDFATRLGGV
jgi:hypothetical protein